MNSYLIESEDSLSLEKEKESIIKTQKMESYPENTYDMEEVPLENALEDLDTYSFLSDKKIIIIKNIEILKYDDNKEDINHLLKYIENPNPDNLLIIEAKKLNNTTKITKELKKKCQYQKAEVDITSYIKNELKGYKVDSSIIKLIESKCLNDVTKIHNECEKLKNYKYDEKEITKEDVENLIIQKLGDPQQLTFDLARTIAEKNKKESLRKYRELLKYNIEPISIIGLLASQIRIIYQVKILEKEHLTNKEIAEKLGEKSDYRIKKTKELTPYYNEKELLLLMQKLSDMDLQIKTSEQDANALMELFILNMEKE